MFLGLIGGYLLVCTWPGRILSACTVAVIWYWAARKRDLKRDSPKMKEMMSLIGELFPPRDDPKEPAVTALARVEPHLPSIPGALKACLIRLPVLESEADGRLVDATI